MYLNDMLCFLGGLLCIPAFILTVITGVNYDNSNWVRKRSYKALVGVSILLCVVSFGLFLSAVFVAFYAPHTTGGTP